jgi:probable F420-dependent oxidoreductase
MVDRNANQGLSGDPEILRSRLGRTGAWLSAISSERANVTREAAAEIEQLGYGAWWGGEGPRSRDVFANSSLILEATSDLIVTTAVANIYARDPMAMKSGALTLGDAFPGRFQLGIGVSHAPLVDDRGHSYAKPLASMRAYLDAMDAYEYVPPAPEQKVPLLLAALGPKMLELSGDRTCGTHTYFVPVAHTSHARALLGPDPYIAVEQMFVLDTDADRARAVARRAMAPYLENFPNYVNNLRQLGYEEPDFANGGSDRLADALVVSGTVASVVARMAEHLDAGADHVCVQPLAAGLDGSLAQLRELAPALSAL